MLSRRTEVEMTALLSPPALSAGLLAGADADLDALADRLHDGVLQALVVARYACDAVTRGADPALARDAVQDALVALRREVWLLRPRAEDGLAAALADLSAQLVAAGRPGLALDLDPAAAAALSPARAALAYRLVQAVVADDLLAVRLTAGALVLDACLPDSSTWSLRARALGAELRVTEAHTQLLLPTDEDHP